MNSHKQDIKENFQMFKYRTCVTGSFIRVRAKKEKKELNHAGRSAALFASVAAWNTAGRYRAGTRPDGPGRYWSRVSSNGPDAGVNSRRDPRGVLSFTAAVLECKLSMADGRHRVVTTIWFTTLFCRSRKLFEAHISNCEWKAWLNGLVFYVWHQPLFYNKNTLCYKGA